MAADRYTPVDATLIPTGHWPLSTGRRSTSASRRRSAPGSSEDPQLQFGNGYDHNWVLARSDPRSRWPPCPRSESGRTLRGPTTEPGCSSIPATSWMGRSRGRGAGLPPAPWVLPRTQHFPDSPNHRRSPRRSCAPVQSTDRERYSSPARDSAAARDSQRRHDIMIRLEQVRGEMLEPFERVDRRFSQTAAAFGANRAAPRGVDRAVGDAPRPARDAAGVSAVGDWRCAQRGTRAVRRARSARNPSGDRA